MPEDRSPDRPRDEADRIDGEGLQRADPGIGMRKEQFCENQAGDGAVEEEVIPLDRGPDRGGDHRTTHLQLMLGWCELVGVEAGDWTKRWAKCCHAPR